MIVDCKGTSVFQDWIDGILVSIFKGKDSKSVCDSYRGILLFFNQLARIMINKLINNLRLLVIPEAKNCFKAEEVLWI